MSSNGEGQEARRDPGLQQSVSNAGTPTSYSPRDLAALLLPALLLLLVHLLVLRNGYGFHRDELQFLSDAWHLDWGYVAYPPLTAWCARLATALLGSSPEAMRLPAVLANGVSLVAVALLARTLGGGRRAQLLAGLFVFPLALALSSLMQYNTFDLLAWTLLALFTARVLRTGDERNWLGAGFAAGLGVLSKYSIAFPLVSLLAGLVLLPSARRHLRSRWFWSGVLLAVCVSAPNLVWLLREHGITLRMETFIHARDVRLGRAKGFWMDQLRFTLLLFPLVVLGLVTLLRDRRFRLLAVFCLGPLVLLAAAKGRGYYMLPGYIAVYAAAAVALERFALRRSRGVRAGVFGLAGVAVAVSLAAVIFQMLPVFPVTSAMFRWQMHHSEDLANEIGWPELVRQVAAVRDALPPEDKARLAILAENYGEAGAIELYGPQFGLPAAISPVNSFHRRGWGPFEPETVLVVGSTLRDEEHHFLHCRVVGQVLLPLDVRNEENDDHPNLLLCRGLKGRWPEVWAAAQSFG